MKEAVTSFGEKHDLRNRQNRTVYRRNQSLSRRVAALEGVSPPPVTGELKTFLEEQIAAHAEARIEYFPQEAVFYSSQSPISLKKVGEGFSIETAGFVSTLRQLQVLFYRTNGLSRDEVAEKLQILPTAVKRSFSELQSANEEFYTDRPNLIQLAVRAYNLELLYPLSIAALEKVAGEL